MSLIDRKLAKDTNIPSNDCISRQAAIDIVVFECGKWTGLAKEICKQIKQLPTTQPEIIRCKDCKHYQFADNRAFGMPVKMCKWFGFEDVDDDDFCSRAERREE